MINNTRFINWVNLLSFGIGLFALYVAFANLKMNDNQSGELKDILHYLEQHLQDQDKHLREQDLHLANQDQILENLTK